MKLSKAQLVYIRDQRAKMDKRMKDLDTFGDDIYKSAALSAERGRIYYDRWFYNHMLNLHNVELEAETASFEALKDEVEKVMSE